MAYLDESVISQVQAAMHPWVLCCLKDWFKDPDLMASFKERARDKSIDEAEAAQALIHALWKTLKGTHRLKVVG